MTEKTTVTVGPWPESRDDGEDLAESGSSAELVSMTLHTFERLVDELGEQSELNVRLRAALAVRPSVTLATGVLMCRYGIEEQQALELLSLWSEHTRVGLRDSAMAVLGSTARDADVLAGLGEYAAEHLMSLDE